MEFGFQSIGFPYTFLGTTIIMELCYVVDFHRSERCRPTDGLQDPCTMTLTAYLSTPRSHQTTSSNGGWDVGGTDIMDRRRAATATCAMNRARQQGDWVNERAQAHAPIQTTRIKIDPVLLPNPVSETKLATSVYHRVSGSSTNRQYVWMCHSQLRTSYQ